MPTDDLCRHDVDRQRRGVLRGPEQWTEDMAPEIAKGQGIDELTEPTGR